VRGYCRLQVIYHTVFENKISRCLWLLPTGGFCGARGGDRRSRPEWRRVLALVYIQRTFDWLLGTAFETVVLILLCLAGEVKNAGQHSVLVCVAVLFWPVPQQTLRCWTFALLLHRLLFSACNGFFKSFPRAHAAQLWFKWCFINKRKSFLRQNLEVVVFDLSGALSVKEKLSDFFSVQLTMHCFLCELDFIAESKLSRFLLNLKCFIIAD